LKPELTIKAVLTGTVPLKRFLAVPYSPKVCVSPLGIVIIVSVAQRAVRAARPVIPLWIQPVYNLREKAIEKFTIILPTHAVPLRAPLICGIYLLYLVVSAPKRQTGMMAYALHIILRLSPYSIHEFLIK
jgi:hypothetical protein